MDSDDKAWVEQAIEQVSRAATKNVIVLLIGRNPDSNCEMVVTNAASHEMVSAMWPTEITEG